MAPVAAPRTRPPLGLDVVVLVGDLTSARPLDDDQVGAIKQNLRARMGRDIAVEMNVDPAILGGLVVKIGSQRIDGSIRTKLNTLANAMKG